MPNSNRMMVDLIRKAPGTGGYLNLHPPERIEVGDYGIINKQTGAFDKEGNIYDQWFAREFNLDLLTTCPPKMHDPEDKFVIVTKGGKDAGLGGDAIAKLVGLTNASVQGHWKFHKGRGAVLVMIKPTLTTIPQYNVRPKLQHLDVLAEKALVTGVYSCPTYALLLTNDFKAEVGFAWSATVSEATGTVGGGTFGRWGTHTTSGVWRTGGEVPNSTFFPLFRLETPKTRKFMDIWKGYRTSPIPTPEGDETFRPYSPPWRLLNQEGDEIPINDDVSDSE